MTQLTPYPKRHFLFHVLFWSWNLLLATVLYFGLAPFLFTDFVLDFSDLPPGFIVCIAAALITPGAALIVGFAALRRHPDKLMNLLFAVEVPVLLATITRVFAVHELSASATLLLGCLLFGTLAHAILLVRPPTANWWRVTLHIGQAVGVCVAAYVALLVLVFIPPMVMNVGESLLTGAYFEQLFSAMGRGAIETLVVLVGGFSALVLIAVPPAFIACHINAFIQSARSFEGRARTMAFASALLIGFGVLSVADLMNLDAPAVLARLDTSATAAERQSRLADADHIRERLIDAYLWRYRYFARADETSFVGSTYRQSNLDFAADTAEIAFAGLASPFLYGGAYEDVDRARDHYRAFFDESIQRGARREIKRALRSTYERNEVPANLLDVDERAVHLQKQEITVTPADVGATIEIFDTYVNQTNDDVEVLYYFSLPDTAAVTGLWLSDTAPSKANAFRFRVAPRGAAQRTYSREVRRRVDPALLEQIGPRQYRLRAFPVPGQPRTKAETKRLYLWLQYQALPNDGAWPLPELFEARNVYWDARTDRRINGVKRAGNDAWRETRLSVAAPVARSKHVYAIGEDLAVVATPTPSGPTVPRGGRQYAVIVDRTYSMTAERQQLEESFDWLRETIYPESSVDLYLTASPIRGTDPERIDDEFGYDVTREVFYGSQSTGSMLEQAFELANDADINCPIGHRGIECYDAVIVLTDRGRIELEENHTLDWRARVPLWVVHVGGTLAMGYGDAVTEAIQRSGGGVTGDIRQVFSSLALAERHGGAYIGFGGDYTFTLEPYDGITAGSDGFGPLAARQFVRAAMQTMDVSDRNVLDRLHRVATTHEIVTAYSSMIVLVLQRQHDALDKANKDENRFDRNATDDEERLRQPSDFGVTGSPEPHEWVLIFLGAALLLYFGRDRLKFVAGGPISWS